MPLSQLRRIRWAVRATLVLGVAASVVANVLHAMVNPVSQAIAAWPPLALLLTVELISRVPVHRRALAAARFVATATIAGIAAWVSYWHMVGVAARYGETGASPYLLPLSVDGLIVVASICLVELGGRISAAQAAATGTGPDRAVTGADRAGAAPERVGQAGAARQVEDIRRDDTTATIGARPTDTGTGDGVGPSGHPVPEPVTPPARTPRTGPAGPVGRTGATRATDGTAARKRTGAQPAARPAAPAASRPRRPVAETAALAAAIEAARPGATEAEIAQELGITVARLRTVRRQTREPELTAPTG